MTQIQRGQVLLTGLVAAILLGVAAPNLVEAGQRIVNGLDTQDFPTTGALLYSGGGTIGPNNATTQCTGTLIGCQTFLTAAHCVEEDTVASHYQVYLQNGGISAVSSIAVHPSYSASTSGEDVAIVKLSSPVTGIDPTTVNTSHDLDALGVGFPGTIAGFGQTSGSGNDYGVKRYGAIISANCNTAATGGEGNDVLVCFDYAAPVGAPGEDSNTCNGDSGGPLFMDFSGSTEVVGATSAGSSPACAPLDHSWDASVYHNRAWIIAQLGADSTATCGGIAPVGDPSVTVQQNNGTLGSGNLDDSFTVEITGMPTTARFTLNGTDDGSFNPNFFVKEGLGASAANFDCKADGSKMYGACEFANPGTGTWSVFVQRAAGGGQYQVTTTVFGGDPPICGNDTAESGEECDGSDLGSCTAGPCIACACPAPVCGNDVVEAGEECDGTSDAACPGQCAGDCSCPAPTCGNSILEVGEDCDGTSDAACPGQCAGDCSCASACTSGDLYGIALLSDARRFSYKALLFDDQGTNAALDPRDSAFTLDITDIAGSVGLLIPADDSGWVKADPDRGRYAWKGTGSLDGFLRVKLNYKPSTTPPAWSLKVTGKAVVGADTLNLTHVLDFNLGFGGTCHLESW